MLCERFLALSLALSLDAVALAPAAAAASGDPPRARLSPEEIAEPRETVHLVMLSRIERAQRQSPARRGQGHRPPLAPPPDDPGEEEW